MPDEPKLEMPDFSKTTVKPEDLEHQPFLADTIRTAQVNAQALHDIKTEYIAAQLQANTVWNSMMHFLERAAVRDLTGWEICGDEDGEYICQLPKHHGIELDVPYHLECRNGVVKDWN